MIVALTILAALLAVVALAAIVMLDRFDRRATKEREHLVHLIVARHVGEVRAMEAPFSEQRREPTSVSIEGLS